MPGPYAKYAVPYSWNSTLPASRWHAPQIDEWLAYQEPLDQAKLLHNQEHGEIALQHGNDLVPDDLTSLQTLVDHYPRKLVLAPNPESSAPLVATAWGTLPSCTAFGRDAVARFIETFRDQGPESVE